MKMKSDFQNFKKNMKNKDTRTRPFKKVVRVTSVMTTAYCKLWITADFLQVFDKTVSFRALWQ